MGEIAAFQGISDSDRELRHALLAIRDGDEEGVKK